MIDDFAVEKDQLIVKWLCNNKQILLKVDNLDQSMVDESRQMIFVLSGPQQLPTKLTILDETGEEIFSCSPPVGADFYYLTKTPMLEVLIVCAFEEKLEGWHDWHYSFDPKNKILLRGAPSY